MFELNPSMIKKKLFNNNHIRKQENLTKKRLDIKWFRLINKLISKRPYN